MQTDTVTSVQVLQKVTIIYYEKCKGDLSKAKEEMGEWKLFSEMKEVWIFFQDAKDKKEIIEGLGGTLKGSDKALEFMNDDGEYLIELIGPKDAGQTWAEAVDIKYKEVGKKYGADI